MVGFNRVEGEGCLQLKRNLLVVSVRVTGHTSDGVLIRTHLAMRTGHLHECAYFMSLLVLTERFKRRVLLGRLVSCYLLQSTKGC